MTEAISTELRHVLRQLKLSPMLATLPERMILARQQKLPYQDFLELVLADEVGRREQVSAQHRAHAGLLDPSMSLEAWDSSTDVHFDQQLWNELCSLRFLEEAASVLILGPVGVGKTMLANCLGHIACRRRHSVLMLRTERMLKRLKAARLDASYDQELRRLIRVDLLILDDFALQGLRPSGDPGHLRAHRRAASPLQSGRSLQPGAGGVVGNHGRPPARPVRRRSPPQFGLRVGPRGRVLPQAAEADPPQVVMFRVHFITGCESASSAVELSLRRLGAGAGSTAAGPASNGLSGSGRRNASGAARLESQPRPPRSRPSSPPRSAPGGHRPEPIATHCP